MMVAQLVENAAHAIGANALLARVGGMPFEQLLAEPESARRLGRAGRQRVIQEFSLERMVRQTEQLYLRLLRTHGALR